MLLFRERLFCRSRCRLICRIPGGAREATDLHCLLNFGVPGKIDLVHRVRRCSATSSYSQAEFALKAQFALRVSEIIQFLNSVTSSRTNPMIEVHVEGSEANQCESICIKTGVNEVFINQL